MKTPISKQTSLLDAFKMKFAQRRSSNS